MTAKKIGGIEDVPRWNIVRTSLPKIMKLKDGTEKTTKGRRKVVCSLHALDADVAVEIFKKYRQPNIDNYIWTAEAVS